jgi:hypothetical protein
MAHEIFKHRGRLNRTLRKLKEGSLTIGFVGGSITDGRGLTNWPEPVISWFVDKFPEVKISVENAAIGGTGSNLAVLRAQRDLIDRKCDLVFIEYAVNDYSVPTENRMRSREGLVRKLLAGEGMDLVFVYVHSREMIPYYIEESMPDSIKEFEEIARHYHISSIWAGLYAFQEVEKGKIRWEEWVTDGVHPDSRGSLCYGTGITEFLDRELSHPGDNGEIKKGLNMPQPLNPQNWENAYVLPLSEVTFKAPFKLRRWADLEWMDQAIETSAIGARLSFAFEGRGLGVGFDVGKLSSDFKYRIDQGEWVLFKRERADWMPPYGLFEFDVLCEDLPQGKHTCELETAFPTESRYSGARFCFGLIGVIR